MRPSGTSHCHPIHSSVKPWRISAPLPNSASVADPAELAAFWNDRQDPLAAAVAGFVEQPAVAARGIDRLQQVEVGGELDQALRVLRRQIEVDDALVLRQRRIEREVDLADQLLVRPGGAEGLPSRTTSRRSMRSRATSARAGTGHNMSTHVMSRSLRMVVIYANSSSASG